MKEINYLYHELANIYASGDIKGADEFYNTKIVPLLKKDNKRMKKQTEEF